MAALDGPAHTVNSSQDPTSVSRTPKPLSYHQLQTLQQQKKHKEARGKEIGPPHSPSIRPHHRASHPTNCRHLHH